MMKVISFAVILGCACTIHGGCSQSKWPARSHLTPAQAEELNQIAAINAHTQKMESLAFTGEIWTIGAVDWDSSILPLVSPDGRFIASSVGSAPSSAARLALPGNVIPGDTSVEVWEILGGYAGLRSIKRLPPSLLLGDSADDEGFLVESPQADGSRWIGKVDWRTGDLRWLVKNEEVNAFATLGTRGRLAWCSRPVDREHFDLTVRFPEGTQFKLLGRGAEWLLPQWSTRSAMLYAWRLTTTGQLSLVALDGESPATIAGEAKQIAIMAGANRFDPFRATSNRHNVHGLPAPFVEEIVFYDPANHCMAVWMPTGINSDRTVLLAMDSIAATHDHNGNFLLTMPEGLHWQGTSDLRQIVRVNHVPLFARRTTDPMRPFLLLDPGKEVVRIRGMRPQNERPVASQQASGT